MDGRESMAAGESISESASEWTYRDDLRLFLGKNPEPFLYAYDQQAAGKQRVGLCWPAIFVPMAWLMYRRLYLYAGGILILGILLAIIFPSKSSGGAAGFAAICGAMAKPLYLTVARQKIDKAGKRAVDEADRRRRIVSSGGVSVIGAVIGSIISALPILMIFVPR